MAGLPDAAGFFGQIAKDLTLQSENAMKLVAELNAKWAPFVRNHCQITTCATGPTVHIGMIDNGDNEGSIAVGMMMPIMPLTGRPETKVLSLFLHDSPHLCVAITCKRDCKLGTVAGLHEDSAMVMFVDTRTGKVQGTTEAENAEGKLANLAMSVYKAHCRAAP